MGLFTKNKAEPSQYITTPSRSQLSDALNMTLVSMIVYDEYILGLPILRRCTKWQKFKSFLLKTLTWGNCS